MGISVSDLRHLRERSHKIQSMIRSGVIPESICNEIRHYYSELSGGEGKSVPVSVRSSALSEDMAAASFAGQLESFLNVEGLDSVLNSIVGCYASLYSERAISYRLTQGIPEERMGISVGIQKMIRSDLGVAGVMFTIDPETGFDQAIVINASYGWGESVVKGAVNPDEYVVHKAKLNEGFAPILRRSRGFKDTKVTASADREQRVQNERVPEDQQKRFALNLQEILQLARWAVIIENHFSKR